MQANEKRVLLVEDEPDIIEMYRMVLQGGGITLEIAETRKEAWQRLQKTNYDLVLLDIIIPASKDEALDFSAREGFKLLEDIRSDNNLFNLKVIILTNLDSLEDRKRAHELNSEYVVKAEIVPKELLDKVLDILDKE